MDKLKKRVITVLNENGKVKKSELTQTTSGYLENGVSELNRLLRDLEELEIIRTTKG